MDFLVLGLLDEASLCSIKFLWAGRGEQGALSGINANSLALWQKSVDVEEFFWY